VGRLLSVTNPLGETLSYQYNPLNEKTQITDPAGKQIRFSYDGNGNSLAVTDANQNATSYTYDSMDRVIARTDSLNHSDNHQYDQNGNLIQFTDRRGVVVSYKYDALNRKILASFGTESSISYSYDAVGRLIQTVDSLTGTILRSYDALDRLIKETSPQGTVVYTYDSAGRRTSMNVSGQPTVQYSYDNDNHLTGIVQGNSSVAFAYDADGRRTVLTLPNGISMTYNYDEASQLTGIIYALGSSTLGNLNYVYDLAGRRADMGGSFARTNLPAALTTASYNADNQLMQFGPSSLTYDANGNLISDGVNTYTWDARNQLASISGGVLAHFQYDSFGRRISRAVGSATTQYLYDDANAVQELSADVPTANLLTGLGVDGYFQRRDSAGPVDFLTDGSGSTMALADSSGVIQTRYTFNPFGDVTSSGAPSTNSFQFTGRENDNIGLYFYRARYYDPALGRFISEDPIGFAGSGPNLYSYAHNSPTNLVDPLGLADNATPWQVGWEWLTGTGPRTHQFTDGDPFTELLRQHQHIQDLVNDVCSGALPAQGRFDYNLGGLGGVPKYLKDYSTLFTGGLTGNLAVTYLGSYGLSYSVSDGTLNIHVWNVSSIASATHPPVIGYTDWWNTHIGNPLNDFFSSGPMSATTQTFDFHEDLAGRGCGCQVH